MLFIISCAKEIPCPPQAVKIPPPVPFIMTVPEPVLLGQTNKELANWAVALREALRRSNQDKRELQIWLQRWYLESAQEQESK